MSRRPRSPRAARVPTPTERPGGRPLQQLSLPERLAWWALAAVILGTAWAVDPWADASFDAPKRLVWLVGSAAAAGALWWEAGARVSATAWRSWPRLARITAGLAACGALWLVWSAVASLHPEHASSSLRTITLAGLLIPVGASRLLDGSAGRRLPGVFALAAGTTSLLSVLQAMGMTLPFTLSRLGGRLPTGALLGNEGYVAIVAAMLAASGLAVAVSEPRGFARTAALAMAGLGFAAVVVNENTTSAAALGVAVATILAVRFRRPWIAAVIAVMLVAGAAAALVEPVRAQTWDVVLRASHVPLAAGDGRVLTPIERYDRLTTYRLGAWIAAAGMVADRPLSGYGPGTFAAEFLPHRLDAELRLGARFVQPAAATFVQAHQDYLQLAAEAGVPALLFVAGAGALLLWWLVFARTGPGPGDPERLVLIGVLSTGAIAALAWFPFQIPLTATALLLAAGRTWRRLRTCGGGGA